MSPEDIEDGLSNLNIIVERLKDGVNRCSIGTIVVNSKVADLILNNLRPNLGTFTEKQKGLINDLYIESNTQLNRLYKGRCACGLVKDV